MVRWSKFAALAAAALATGATAGDVLVTSGFTNCDENSDIKVQNSDIRYDNSAKKVTFNLAGSSAIRQKVMASLTVSAYGKELYTSDFDPCDDANYVKQLCPVPAGTFAAEGSQAIPDEVASQIPAVAFNIPDISATATMQLKAKDGGAEVGCVTSKVTNGKTIALPSVSYIAAGIAAGALVLSGVGAASAAMSGGAGGALPSPTFTEVMGVFQGFAMNGMMSVKHPDVYRKFTTNFAFSTGLIPWAQLQTSIDHFRNVTGGNTTADSYALLQNTTTTFGSSSSSIAKRSLVSIADLISREINTSVNGTGDAQTEQKETGFQATMSGIEKFANDVSVPSSDVFMTILLIAAIVIASIIVIILLVKVILEFWALFGSFPKGLTGFRKHYWGTIGRTITSLIFLVYGIWVLYCVFQFAIGDSIAAQALAGVTLAIFTGVLAFFALKIILTARKVKASYGDESPLYQDKSLWMKYSLFYDLYKKSYWWAFVPLLVYMLAKGIVMGTTDTNGMAQCIALIIVEGLFLILLCWNRPYERRSGNVVNICIQVVRVLSVVCILVFVEEFNIEETTTTITGVVLIVLQAALAGALGILLCWNAIVICCKENPHRKKRKEMEKMRGEGDALTPLDARNSLLHDRSSFDKSSNTFAMSRTVPEKEPLSGDASERYTDEVREPSNPYSGFNSSSNAGAAHQYNRSMTPTLPFAGESYNHSSDNLVSSAAPVTGYHDRTYSGPYAQRSYSPYRS